MLTRASLASCHVQVHLSFIAAKGLFQKNDEPVLPAQLPGRRVTVKTSAKSFNRAEPFWKRQIEVRTVKWGRGCLTETTSVEHRKPDARTGESFRADSLTSKLIPIEKEGTI